MSVDVLVPTRNRPVELGVTLAGLAAQEGPLRRVIVSDQSDERPSFDTAPARAMARQLERRGVEVEFVRHLPRRGLAEHRDFLLGLATASHVLFLDDDVWLEPGTLSRLWTAMSELRCGFVGNAMQGLSFLDDRRPGELEPYEEWGHGVEPEVIGSAEERRWTLHNAANLVHLAEKMGLRAGEWRPYKVAWVAGCVLFDREKLAECGGFDFWRELPAEHAGEDVAAQWRVMAKHGGAGVLPSGAVHLESETTVPQRDVQAVDVVSVRHS